MLKDQEFIKAIIANDLAKIKLLITNVNINTQDENNNTALHLAIKSQNLEIIKLLIANDIDVNIVNKDGDTALDLAAKDHNSPAIKYLLAADAHINSQNQQLLFWAVKNDDLSIMEKCQKSGININTPDENGNTALNLAASYDKYFMIDYLLRNGADINYQNQQLLFWAAKNNNLAIIKQYLANGADINTQDENGNTILDLAATNYVYSSDVINYLLTENVNTNYQSQQLFFWAAKTGNLAIIKQCLASGINIDTTDEDNNTALHLAIKKRAADVFNFLIAKGADITIENKDDETVLHLAARYQQGEIIDFLLKRGVDVNTQNKKGNTALMHIVGNEYLLQVVNFLIANKADIKIKNNDGDTALDLAAKYNNYSAVIALLKQDAHINYQNQQLLFWAAKSDNLAIMKQCLASGINIDTPDENGNTALHLAIKHKNLHMVNFLIANEADTNNIADHNNKTAFTYIQAHMKEKLFLNTYLSDEMKSILTIFPQFLNQQDKFGNSPLMIQIKANNMEMINYFLTKKEIDINLQNDDGDTALHLSLTCLPQATALQQQLFTPETANIILKGETKKEIATFLTKNGETKKYVFTIKKAANDEYSLSQPVISNAERITAKIFVVDFASNTNNGTQENTLFELQSLADSGLGFEENHLYLKKVFDQLLPDTNYYYPGDRKRGVTFLNANHPADNKLVVFKQCDSNINDKALQLFIAHTMCNLKNDGSVYPISKIYCTEKKDEIIANITQTVKDGKIKRGVLKAFHEYQGAGNTFIDFSQEKLNKSHLHDNKIIFQENISRLSAENGKYNSFRGLVVFFEDNKYQQYNNAIIFLKTCTSDYNSHNMQTNDYKEAFYCEPKHSTEYWKYQGIVPEVVALRTYNKQLFAFLTGFIPVVNIMDNYLQQPWDEEKQWKEKMAQEATNFNSAADDALRARTKVAPFNATTVNDFMNWLQKESNSQPITAINNFTI